MSAEPITRSVFLNMETTNELKLVCKVKFGIIEKVYDEGLNMNFFHVMLYDEITVLWTKICLISESNLIKLINKGYEVNIVGIEQDLTRLVLHDEAKCHVYKDKHLRTDCDEVTINNLNQIPIIAAYVTRENIVKKLYESCDLVNQNINKNF